MCVQPIFELENDYFATSRDHHQQSPRGGLFSPTETRKERSTGIQESVPKAAGRRRSNSDGSSPRNNGSPINSEAKFASLFSPDLSSSEKARDLRTRSEGAPEDYAPTSSVAIPTAAADSNQTETSNNTGETTAAGHYGASLDTFQLGTPAEKSSVLLSQQRDRTTSLNFRQPSTDSATIAAGLGPGAGRSEASSARIRKNTPHVRSPSTRSEVGASERTAASVNGDDAALASSEAGPTSDAGSNGYHLAAFPGDLSPTQQRSLSSRDLTSYFGVQPRSRQTSRSVSNTSPSSAQAAAVVAANIGMRARVPSVRDIIAAKDISATTPLFHQMYDGERLSPKPQSSPNLARLNRTHHVNRSASDGPSLYRNDGAGGPAAAAAAANAAARARGAGGGGSAMIPRSGSAVDFGAAGARSRARGKSSSQLSLSDAKQALYQQSVSGILIKRGFGGLQRWRPRFFALRGRILSYYTSQAAALRAPGRPRGQLEIQKLTRIRRCSYGPDRQFGIEVLPPPVHPRPPPVPEEEKARNEGAGGINGSGGSAGGHNGTAPSRPRAASTNRTRRGSQVKQPKQPPPWMMVARHEAERTAWLEKLVAVIRLIERVEEPATLRGLGSVHDHFKMGKFLGKGRFGVVRMCTHHLSDKVFAIKIINKNKKRLVSQMSSNKHLTVDALDATLQNELRVLRCIKQRIGTKSPFLCNTYEVYEDSHLVCIVMEYLPGGDLFDAIIRHGNFQELDAARIALQLTSGLKSLHWAGVIHRDMKPENILFTAARPDSGAMNVKIADFGCSLLMSNKKKARLSRGTTTYLKLRQIVGTPGYMSPEVLEHGHYGPPCDVFAVGVILYVMPALFKLDELHLSVLHFLPVPNLPNVLRIPWSDVLAAFVPGSVEYL